MTVDHRLAAGIVEQALMAVFDPDLVRRLREDSPLAALGMVPADAVAVADAVESSAADLGVSCLLSDADLATATTVAELVVAVQAVTADAEDRE
jgi:hypothetical protein